MRIVIALIALLALAIPANADHGWHGGGGHWGGGWHGGYGGGDGSGFVGGILGGFIGSLLAPAPPVVVAPQAVPELQPWTPPWYSYCSEKFRSFDPKTGYYTGYDGKAYFCQ